MRRPVSRQHPQAGGPATARVPSRTMQDTAAAAEISAEPGLSSRSWSRALGDLRDGWRQRQLWGHLGWQDIRQGYRRSVIGPLWITISLGVQALGMGLLYAALFGQPIAFFLPYLAVGLIIWQFMASCINEGAEVFIRNEGLIKHLPAPLSVHVFRLVWRQLLFFGHNVLVWAALVLIFRTHLGWGSLMAFPALAVIVLNGAWVAVLIGIIATRYRDIPPVTSSVVTLMFFMTPIVWNYEDLISKGGPGAHRARLAELNPFLHFVEILRRPMIGESFELRNWVVCLAITVVGWAAALLILRNYRARVSYWV
ncbi:MAG: ABC transporter permease [Pseudonocardiaceae bacterium]|nr:ABC transporter permease [Pseudonocardiaceae bacterium]